MIRTQIQLEQDQYERLREVAHRQRISISELVRRLVRQGLDEAGSPAGRNPVDDLLELSGISSSGLDDLGRDHAAT